MYSKPVNNHIQVKTHGNSIVSYQQGLYIAYHLALRIVNGLINSAQEQSDSFIEFAQEYINQYGEGKVVNKIPPATLSDFMKKYGIVSYSKSKNSTKNKEFLASFEQMTDDVNQYSTESTNYQTESTIPQTECQESKPFQWEEDLTYFSTGYTQEFNENYQEMNENNFFEEYNQSDNYTYFQQTNNQNYSYEWNFSGFHN